LPTGSTACLKSASLADDIREPSVDQSQCIARLVTCLTGTFPIADISASSGTANAKNANASFAYRIRSLLLGRIIARGESGHTRVRDTLSGQTRTARPKDAGTETHQHSQSTPRSRYRSSVQTEPVLRSQRSSPGPLRDAAAAQHRGDVDSRCGRCVWSLPAHVLSGAECFQPGWPGWIVARSTWSE